MAFLGQDEYLQVDRYYTAVIVYPAGALPESKWIHETLTASHLWWWEFGGGKNADGTLEWRIGYLKNIGMNVRPRKIAEGLHAAAVLVSKEDVSEAISLLFGLLEKWAGFFGVDASEGATLASYERPIAGAQYAMAIDWGKKPVLPPEAIIENLASIGVEVFQYDCGSWNPLEGKESSPITYGKDAPTTASLFIRCTGATAPTAGEIRDAVKASVVYIIREPAAGTIEAEITAKACAATKAVTEIATVGSRTAWAALQTVEKLTPTDPGKWLRIALGVGGGLGLVWFGVKTYQWFQNRKKAR